MKLQEMLLSNRRRLASSFKASLEGLAYARDPSIQIIPVIENQMDKKMENEWKPGS